MIALVAGVAATLGSCSGGGGFVDGTGARAALGASELRIESVSTRPYLVTGGDVLLRVDLGSDLDVAQVEVFANGSCKNVDDASLAALPRFPWRV
jgi:hypothetical protein